MKIMRTLVFSAVIIQGCSMFHRQQPPPEDVVFALDATASVVPASFDEAIKAIEAHVDGMRRGDCMTVLPIISDSDALPSEDIVRGCAPTDRQPYDQDLKAFRDRMRRALEEQGRHLSARKAAETDILGTLNLVDQELEMAPPMVRRQVVIFSDFIEEDRTRNFVVMREMADISGATRIARELSSQQQASPLQRSPFSDVPVLLGGLASSELPRLPEERRAAIRHFWMVYFKSLGAKPMYVNDGPGMSARLLAHPS